MAVSIISVTYECDDCDESWDVDIAAWQQIPDEMPPCPEACESCGSCHETCDTCNECDCDDPNNPCSDCGSCECTCEDDEDDEDWTPFLAPSPAQIETMRLVHTYAMTVPAPTVDPYAHLRPPA